MRKCERYVSNTWSFQRCTAVGAARLYSGRGRGASVQRPATAVRRSHSTCIYYYILSIQTNVFTWYMHLTYRWIRVRARVTVWVVML